MGTGVFRRPPPLPARRRWIGGKAIPGPPAAPTVHSIKPGRWGVGPHIAQHRASNPLWREMVFATPLWEGGGDPRDVVGNESGFLGGTTWIRTAGGFALDLNGTTDLVNFGNLKFGLLSALTVECIFSLDVVPLTGAGLVSQNDSLPPPIWSLDVDTVGSTSGRTNTVTFFVLGGGVISLVEGSTNIVAAGKRVHVVGQWRETPEQIRLFVNGRLDQSDTLLNGVTGLDVVGHPLRLGVTGSPGIFLNGQIELVRIWSRYLTEVGVGRSFIDTYSMFRLPIRGRRKAAFIPPAPPGVPPTWPHILVGNFGGTWPPP